VRGRLGAADVLLASGMLSLAELAGALPQLAALPKVVYFHESQLSYPVPKGETPDVHFGFTNLSTALAADGIVFNSRFHQEEFLGGIERFLKPMPDHRPRGLAAALRPKCSVVHPGIDCAELDRRRFDPDRSARPVTILWNHRWEFDKQPEVFFAALHALAAEGFDFRVHLVGENFQVRPKVFLETKERLGGRIATFGHLPRREDYVHVLWDSDIVVSTAVQEFFGIAVMEAAYCRARPLLPRRLVYPELYPERFLYARDEDFAGALRHLLTGGVQRIEEAERAICWRAPLLHDADRPVHGLVDQLADHAPDHEVLAVREPAATDDDRRIAAFRSDIQEAVGDVAGPEDDLRPHPVLREAVADQVVDRPLQDRPDVFTLPRRPGVDHPPALLLLHGSQDVPVVPVHGREVRDDVHEGHLEIPDLGELAHHPGHRPQGAILVVDPDQQLAHGPPSRKDVVGRPPRPRRL
jgi:hypothetical protein